MPVGPIHYIEDLLNKLEGDVLVEKVAHGVHEDHLGCLPGERQFKGVIMEGQAKTVRIVWLPHGVESLGQSFSITVLAACADLCTTRSRIPRGFSPLDR